MVDASEHQLGLAGYQAFVRSQLRRFGAAAMDVEDLTQEVWLVALARSPTFSDEHATRAWLSQVCRRVAAGERRSRLRSPFLKRTGQDDPDLPVEPQQADCVERAYDEQGTLSALARLSEAQLDVLSLYGSGELSMREVAALVDEPEATVYSRYRSAIKEVSREMRRAERGSRRASSVPPPPRDSSIPPLSLDHEAAADHGELVLYRSDEELVMGRIGNVLISRWRKRGFVRSADDVGAALKRLHARLGVPVAMVNDIDPDLALPNALERRTLRDNIRATSHLTGVAVDICNTPITRLLTAILNGIMLITRANHDLSLAMVPSIEAGKRWLEPHVTSLSGPLPWNAVVAAIEHIRREP